MFFPIPIPFFRRARTRDMTAVNDTMARLNPQALVGAESDYAVVIEDVSDPDGRMYRLEYQCSPDGRHAIAYCRHNPWGTPSNAGEDVTRCHCYTNGLLCLGATHVGAIRLSPHDLATVVQRARYWCTAFSVLKETGQFPNP
jgi:hypothetical protein